jgi:hypothetical protein
LNSIPERIVLFISWNIHDDKKDGCLQNLLCEWYFLDKIAESKTEGHSDKSDKRKLNKRRQRGSNQSELKTDDHKQVDDVHGVRAIRQDREKFSTFIETIAKQDQQAHTEPYTDECFPSAVD